MAVHDRIRRVIDNYRERLQKATNVDRTVLDFCLQMLDEEIERAPESELTHVFLLADAQGRRPVSVYLSKTSCEAALKRTGYIQVEDDPLHWYLWDEHMQVERDMMVIPIMMRD